MKPLSTGDRYMKAPFTFGKIALDKDFTNRKQEADCHPYYVQQLAQQSWLRTTVECNTEIVNEAFGALVLQLSMLFQNLTDDLSKSQVNFLKALINNVKQLSSKQTLDEYQLGTSANVLKVKKMLIKKEIIDIHGGEICFIDPLYRCWLKKYYFNL